MYMTRIVLLPAYEPEPGMLDLIAELSGQGFQIIVVNDGSSDACRSLFLEASQSAVVLHHPANRGKGAALRTGLAYIREHFSAPYAVLTMDADGQHTVPDALRVLALAEAEPECLALGCRRFTGKVPLRSRFGNRVTRIVFRLAAGCERYPDRAAGIHRPAHRPDACHSRRPLRIRNECPYDLCKRRRSRPGAAH